jgi:ribosomal protein L29
MAKKEDMTKKTDGELSALLIETRAKLRSERFAAAGARPENPNAMGRMKKVVARILTEQRKRELAK